MHARSSLAYTPSCRVSPRCHALLGGPHRLTLPDRSQAASGRRDDCPSDLTIAITAGNGVLAPCCGTMIRPAQREGYGQRGYHNKAIQPPR